VFENACDESVTIRIQRLPDDDEGIVRVLQAAFGRWPKFDDGIPAVDHLRWKRECDPEGLEYNCVAEKDGQIVGAQFYWLQPLKVGEAVVRLAQGQDFCVHPDFQGLGIRTGMKKLAYETVELKAEFSLSVDGDHPAMVHMVEKSGDQRYELANRVHVLQCDLSSVPLDEEHGLRVRRVDRFDERTDEMCADAAGAFQLIVLRTERSLNWRYADPRAGAYSIHIAEEGGRMLGYAAARSSQGHGYIADLLARPGRADAVQALLSASLRQFAKDGVLTAQIWTFVHHPYQLSLSEAGFNTKKRTWLVRAKPRGQRPDNVDFREDPRALLHLTSGDCGVV
jgi:GNAT superfamily N-acetyltransferase